MKGVPRTKRTARPEKRLHDVLSRIRGGDPTIVIDRDDERGLVSLRAGNQYFVLSTSKFDRHISAEPVNIAIKVMRAPEPERWEY